MKKIKSLICLLLCVAAVLSASACSVGSVNKEWVLKVDGVEIPAGVYLAIMVEETNNAKSELQSSEDYDSKADIYSQEIDGVVFTDYVMNAVEQTCKEYVAVNAKFDEAGLSFTEDELENIDYYVDYVWDNGGKEYYTENGVGYDSFAAFAAYDYKRDKLFDYYYKDGGEKEVPEDEISDYFEKNYVSVKLIQESKISSDGQSFLEDDVTQENKERLEGYVDRLKRGEDFDSIKEEFDKLKGVQTSESATTTEAATDEADATTEGATTTEAATTAEGTTAEEETTAAESTTAAEGSTSEDDEPKSTPNVTVFSTADAESTNYPEGLVSAVLGMSVGEAKVIDLDYYCFAALRTDDVTLNPYYLDNYKDNVIEQLKGDEFDDMVKGWTEGQTVEKNNGAVRRYSPKKVTSIG